MSPSPAADAALRASSRPLGTRVTPALIGVVLILGLGATGAASPARADEAAVPGQVAVPAEAVPAPQPAAPVPAEAAVPVPPVDPAAAVQPVAPVELGSRILRLGDTGADVAALQALVGVEQTSTFDAATRKAVRKLQRAAGIRATGVVTARTLERIQKELEDQRSQRASRPSRGSLPKAGKPAASKRFAAAYIEREYGWGSAQMACLSVMWERESNWRHWVSNPNGLYHGIPQTSSREWAKDGYSTTEYMKSPAVQIKVGARYIKSRYGTPCAAWAFWRSHHWY